MENLSSGFSCTPECLSSAVNFSPILRKTWTAHSDSSLERTNGNFPLLPQFSASLVFCKPEPHTEQDPQEPTVSTHSWQRSCRRGLIILLLCANWSKELPPTSENWEAFLFSETCPCLLSAANLFTASRYAMSKAWSNLIAGVTSFRAIFLHCFANAEDDDCARVVAADAEVVGREPSGWLCDKAWGAERRRPSRKGLWKRSFCERPRACGKASSRVLAFVSLSLCFHKNNQTNTLASWTVEHWL